MLRAVDDLAPLFVHIFEFLVLEGKLLHNVGRVKDGLKVHPLSLALNPLLDGVRYVEEGGIPLFDLLLEGLLEGGELHGLREDDVFV